MNIDLKDDYKLTDNEKYYIINIVLSTFDIVRTRALLMEFSNAVKDLGPKSVNKLMDDVSNFASKKSKFNRDQVVSAITPSIEYFFNNTQASIRRKSFNIDVFN